MNDEVIGGISPKTDWNRVRTQSAADTRQALIDDPDVHPTDEAFWDEAKVVMPRRKEPITLRLDADLLAWLRQEKGYQTRINAVLRTYMASQLRK